MGVSGIPAEVFVSALFALLGALGTVWSILNITRNNKRADARELVETAVRLANIEAACANMLGVVRKIEMETAGQREKVERLTVEVAASNSAAARVGELERVIGEIRGEMRTLGVRMDGALEKVEKVKELWEAS